MLGFILVSDTIERITNPFIQLMYRDVDELESGYVYIIHGIELASTFDNFDYLNKKISDSVYWFNNESEINGIIKSVLLEEYPDPLVIFDPKDLEFADDTFYLNDSGMLYILNDSIIYHADLSFLSRIYDKNINIDYVIEDNFFGFDDVCVEMKEIGMISDIYSLEEMLDFCRKLDIIYLLPVLFEYIKLTHKIVEYPINNKYNNPYKNILLAERYLRSVRFNNIDIDKCEKYGLKYGKLPATYNYNGFYSTTGRIFCSSELWHPIQNVPKINRDILYAEPGCTLVEFDFKSFEFDILCQVLGIELKEDAHQEVYDRLVGLPHANSRNIGKRINYSYLYGQNELRLAESIVNDFDYVPAGFKDDFVDSLHEEETFIKVKTFENELGKKLNNGTVQNYFGRRIMVKKSYAILNYYVQSTAADLFNNKMILLVDMLDGINNKVLLQDFDSILVQLSDKLVSDTNIFDDIMNMLISDVGGLKGRVEYKYGKNWMDLI